MPVVQPRPADGLLRDIEPQGADQMEAAAGGRAGAGDIAAVLGDLRLHQHDIEHKTTLLFGIRTNIIVILYLLEFNRNLDKNPNFQRKSRQMPMLFCETTKKSKKLELQAAISVGYDKKNIESGKDLAEIL